MEQNLKSASPIPTKKHVCLIEDDPISAIIAKKLLTRMNSNTNVCIYENGKIAFEEIKSKLDRSEDLPDLILLDLFMPIWDGWEFLEEFTNLKLKKDIPVFILTSSADREDRKKAEKFGLAGNYISKPLNMDKLEKMFQSIKN